MQSSSVGSTIGIRDAAHPGDAGGEAVDVGLLPVDAVGQRRRDEVGEPDAEHVAGGHVGDRQQHDRAHDRPAERGVVEPVHPEPAGDVRVERGAADVLAALLDDQHVDLRERQAGHQRAGELGELALALGRRCPRRRAPRRRTTSPLDVSIVRHTAEQPPGRRAGRRCRRGCGRASPPARTRGSAPRRAACRSRRRPSSCSRSRSGP